MVFRSLIVIMASLFYILCAGPGYAGNGRELHYSCRISSGQTLVTTDEDVASKFEDSNDPLFIEKTEYHPLDITNLDPSWFSGQDDELMYLEDVVVETLVERTEGWTAGTSKTIYIDGESQDDLPIEERTIRIKRRKSHPKEVHYSRDVFPQMTGSVLEVGSIVNRDNGIKGRVVDVTEDEVRVLFEPESKESIDETFGPLMVKDTGNRYEIEIQVEKGGVVRVGPAFGRITAVDDDYFTVDYSHPFGGETLECDVRIAKLSKNAVMIDAAAGSGNKNPDTIETAENKKAEAPKRMPLNSILQTAEAGDLATIEYTAYLDSGEVIWTTRGDVANDPDRKKVEGYEAAGAYSPMDVLIGSEESFPGQAADIAGMKIDEDKTITIAPEDAFGKRNGSLLKTFDREKVLPVEVTMSAQDYVKNFESFPSAGKVLTYNSYLSGEITKVNDNNVMLELSPIQDEMEEEFGYTKITVEDDTIHVRLEPKLGSDFVLEDQTGRVVAVDDDQFTVDFNDPLAGEEVKIDVKLVSLIKAKEFSGKDITWIEDYDAGLEMIGEKNKPAVLLLYAEWCGYCEKMMTETCVDPRIKMMNDDFIWIKVNSDKQKEIGTFYEQKSFPLIVLLDSSGDVVEKISGYRPATDFQAEIKKLLEG